MIRRLLRSAILCDEDRRYIAVESPDVSRRI